MTKEKRIKLQKKRNLILLLSFLALPITIYYMSPVLIIMGASEGVIVGSFILFTVLFLSGFIFGRAFCGWVCPMGAMQEYAFKINDKPARGKGFNLVKWYIWVPWVAIIIWMFIKVGGVSQINPFYQMKSGISMENRYNYIIYYFFITLILALGLFGRKRSFCHTTCWIAPFMMFGNKIKSKWKIPSLHLKSEPEKCTSCGTCTRHCPMSLPVQEMSERGDMFDGECILCGECVSHCPHEVINYKWLKK